MSAPLRKEDFEALFVAPPANDWTSAFSAVQSLNDLNRLVSKFEAETTSWLASLRQKTGEGADAFQEKMEDVSRPVLDEVVIPQIDELLVVFDQAIDAHARPFHDRFAPNEGINRLSSISGGVGRYIRKLLNRIEDARVKRYNALVDMYYGVVALKASLEGDDKGGPTFDDPKALGDFLRKHTA